MKRYGSQSMVAPLKKVLVRRPDEAFGNADPDLWHYVSQPDLQESLREHDAFTNLLKSSGAEVIYHDIPMPDHADAIFVHDPVLISDQGAILLKMGKPLRKGEPEAISQTLEEAGVPIHYQLHGAAIAEGGDLLWIDGKTLAVGLGYRTNAAGLSQLQEALPSVHVFGVELPYYLGPEACLHLMSTISMIDEHLAVVYKPLTSVPFIQFLEDREITIIEVPEHEFETMGPNVLAVAPGQCIMLAGNPITKQRIEAAGGEVVTYQGNQISLKAEGGATCLTRPILRG